MLSSRERVRLAFSFQEPDRIPLFEQSIAPNIASEILGRNAYTGWCGNGHYQIVRALIEDKRDFIVKKIFKDVLDLHLRLDLDIVRPPLAPSIDSKGPSKIIDKYTFLYEDENTSNWYIYRYNPLSMEYMLIDSSIRREGVKAIIRVVEYLEEEPPSVDEGVFEIFDLIYDELGDQKCFAGYGGIGISMEIQWIKLLITDLNIVERYLDQQLKRTLLFIEKCRRHGADFILGGGDLAGTTGPIYSPKLFRKIILPRLRKIVDFCHKYGLKYIFRTDGNIWPIAKELFIESRIDGYGEIDAQAGMRLDELRKTFPNLILWGNVDCANTLVFGPEEKVVFETIQNIIWSGPGGGYILGSSNTIHPNVKAKYFITMLNIAKKYGRYPINRNLLHNVIKNIYLK